MGPIIVGPVSGASPVLKIGGNITTATNANIVVGGTVAGNTNGANAAGAIYQTAGNFISNIPGSIAAFQLGAANNAYGYYSLSGGSVQFNEIGIGGGNVANTGTTGVVDVSGGTFTSTAWITVGRGISQVGVVNVTGGSVVTGTPGGGEFGMNWGGVVPHSTQYHQWHRRHHQYSYRHERGRQHRGRSDHQYQYKYRRCAANQPRALHFHKPARMHF